jgi:TonB family protein
MNNNPLAFANVTSTKYDVGTYADVHGNFTLISADSTLDVQIRSVGFENNLANLKSNIASNKIVLEDDKAVADRVISNLAPDTSRARGTLKSEEPEPADGWTNYDTYMANNLNIPDDLKREQTKGQVELSFRVDQNGEPVDIKVEKSLCQKCDQEAIRLIRQGPKWKKKNKKTKRVTVAIPFDAEQ